MLKRIFATTFVLATLTSCNEPSKEELLARVAKDWSLTIRASQVIPVYPLTEDLQPGDILLVNTTPDGEIKTYQEKGFLPLERQIGRLDLIHRYIPDQTQGKQINLYQDSYREWGDLSQYENNSPLGDLRKSINSANGVNNTILVPLAGFPSYTFSVQRNASVGVALPLQGIPVGLSFLNTDTAFGSVAMKDAYTVGLPEALLEDPLMDWVKHNLTQKLKEVSSDNKPHYLRLITRVYLAKEFTIGLSSAQGSGTAVNAGNSGPDTTKLTGDLNKLLASPSPESGNSSRANSTPASDGQNTSPLPAKSDLPLGGTLKVLYASQNSISLKDTFPRPVVVGYRSVDYKFKDGVIISEGVDTLSKLEGRATDRPISFQPIPSCQKITDWVLKDQSQNKLILNGWLQKNGNDVSISSLGAGSRPELCEKAIKDLNIP